MRRRLRGTARNLLGFVLVLAAAALLLGKAWLHTDGPYLEALPLYPYCSEARAALTEGRAADALELAEAGGCEEELQAARAEWNALAARFARCVDGVWTGRGDDAFGVGCAVASDLVVFGDVRDLTRQGVAWFRGEDTDEVLVALSAAGLALTFTPQIGAGTSLFKAARRAGALSERFAKSVVDLARTRAWRPLGGMLSDAGRISVKLGPGRGARALAYADDADELVGLARFVERAPHPTLALKWGGKSATRLVDDQLYAEALRRGPDGMRLALERGGRALLTRQSLVITAAKSVYRNPEAIAAAAAAMAAFVLRWITWPWVAGIAALLYVVGVVLMAPRRRAARKAGSRAWLRRPVRRAAARSASRRS